MSQVDDQQHYGQRPDPPTTGPPLHSKYVVLRPVATEDFEILRQLELSEELGWRWRYRGATPSPEQWAQTLSTGVLTQFIVLHAESGEPLGLVCLYNANFQNGFAYLAAARFPGARRTALYLMGVVLFLDYVFECWPFRKLYVETTEFNYAQFRSGVGRAFRLEGCLRGHTFHGGRYWDEYLLAMYREDWAERSKVFSAVQFGKGNLEDRG